MFPRDRVGGEVCEENLVRTIVSLLKGYACSRPRREVDALLLGWLPERVGNRFLHAFSECSGHHVRPFLGNALCRL